MSLARFSGGFNNEHESDFVHQSFWLNAYQREMDVVSNNLANVDTLGYKDKRTTFQELLNNGTNANEVGLSQNARNVAINAGLNVQQVNENPVQGVFKSTAGTYDLAIDGEGYFGVRDGANNLYLTRDGSFRRDVEGNLVTSKGMKVEVQSKRSFKSMAERRRCHHFDIRLRFDRKRQGRTHPAVSSAKFDRHERHREQSLPLRRKLDFIGKYQCRVRSDQSRPGRTVKR